MDLTDICLARLVIHHPIHQNSMCKYLPEIWHELKSMMTIQYYSRGQPLVNQGNHNLYQFFVLDGILKISMLNNAGKEVVLRFLVDNELDTIYATWCNGCPSPYSVKAVTRAVVARISLQDWIALLNRHPDFKEQFKLESFRQMIEMVNHHAKLHLNGAAARIKDLMEAKSGVIDRIPQKHLSAYFGLEPETLSRLLKRMESIIKPYSRGS